jgi:hypothetical protein
VDSGIKAPFGLTRNPPGRGQNRRKISLLAKTRFSLDGRFDFWEADHCQVISFPHGPPLEAGFAFLGFWRSAS